LAAPASRPVAAVNGSAATAVPVITSPVLAPAELEEEPAWEDLLTQKSPQSRGREGRNEERSFHSSLLTRRRLLWVVAIASGLVLGLVFVWLVLAWIFRKPADPTAAENAVPAVLYVNSKQGSNASLSISDALARIRGKGQQAVKIIVQDDLAENDVFLDVPNVTIEAEEGKTIRWHPAGKAATKLFSIHKAEGIHIKGFTLDGEDRVEMLVNLYHRCPGVRLEDLKLISFKKYGIWVTNCSGGAGPEQGVHFDRLEIVTTRPEQTAVYFSIVSSVRDAPSKNEFFHFRDCKLEGPGTKVQTKDLTTLDHITLPDGVQPVQH
jgi:hypothetical protein